MAQYFSTSASETQMAWSKRLGHAINLHVADHLKPGNGMAEVLTEGQQPTKCFCWETDLSKRPGDTIRHTFAYPLDHEGAAGQEPLRGFEGETETDTYDYKVDLVRGGVRARTPMAQQRVGHDVRKNGLNRLAQWAAMRMNIGQFLHLCGYKGTADAGYTDWSGRQIDQSKAIWNMNNAVVPIGNTAGGGGSHIYRAGGGANDEAITTEKLTLSDVRIVQEKIRTLTTAMMPPIFIGGQGWYPWFVHPTTWKNLRGDSGFQTQVNTAMMQGGFIQKHPVLTGALGVVEGFIFYDFLKMPPGYNSSTNAAITTVHRSVICGAGALAMAHGQGFAPATPFLWLEREATDPIEKFWHMWSIFGMARPYYTNPQDSVVNESVFVYVSAD